MRNIKSAFTLLEIVIIITLIALIVVAAFVLLNPLGQIQKTFDGKRKTELAQLRKVLEEWYNDKNCYPRPDQICYNAPQAIPGGTYFCQICGNESTSPSFSPYLTKILCDPEHPTKKYLYQVDNVNCPRWYKIYTKLNNKKDPSIAEVGCSSGCGIGNYTGFIYNYGVTSPNTDLEKGPGRYYCSRIRNCSSYNTNTHICFPSFSSPNCDWNGVTRCRSVGTCQLRN